MKDPKLSALTPQEYTLNHTGQLGGRGARSKNNQSLISSLGLGVRVNGRP